MPLSALVLAAAAAASMPSKHPIVPEDTYRIRSTTSLEVTADGSRIAYTLEIGDKSEDSFRQELWVADGDGKNAKRLCRIEDECSDPKFSPDGTKIAYLSDRKDGTQLWVARAGEGRGRSITSVDRTIGDFDWAPDGSRLVFEMDDAFVPTTPPGASSETRGAHQATQGGRKDDTSPWVIKRTQIQRDGVGYLDSRHVHLYVVAATGGALKAITGGGYDDENPRWSPKGDWIAFVSNRSADPDANDDTDIWLVRPDGGAPKRLASNPGPDEDPEWSHAGDRVAFVGALRPNDYYQTNRVMVVPVEGGPSCDLSASLDTWVSADNGVVGSEEHARIEWSADDATLYVPFDRRGANWIAAVPSAGGEAKELLGGPRLFGLVRLAPRARRLYYTQSTPTTLGDVWTAKDDGSGARRLVGPNDDLFAQRMLVVPEKVVARDPDGETVEAWLYPPVRLDTHKKYPMILYIHGGPQEYDGEYFDTGLENQLFPGRGWAVLRVNYRGSTSYGEKFCSSIRGDWHRREFDDLMAAVDEAIRSHPWIDKSSLALGGWSYGGIMTVWTAGHTTRFRVGVPERFEIDYLSAFGTDEWHAQYVTEFGNPWENADKYRELSPGSYLTGIKTPLFLIADEKDGNCPPTQAMQLYQRLKLMGLTTELVIYPDEPHTMGIPSHYVDRLYRLLDWLGRYLD